MINQKMQDAINAQINAELYSSYLYLAMSAWFANHGLPGSASWMKVQALEETTHADKLFNYLLERGGKVTFPAIDAPQTEWDSPAAVFDAVLAHEQLVTSLVNKLMDTAIEEKDHAAQIFLQWFVAEQVEEEAGAQDVIDRVKLTQNNPGAMLMIDSHLASRTFNPPASGE